jgi:uncharacterized protein
MTGHSDLQTLLAQMRPELNDGDYVFTTTGSGSVPSDVHPIVSVAEEEGRTLVLRKEDADRLGLPYDYVAGWITLRVHSSLHAVGLTAAVAAEVARAGLSCNVVAGFYHDHLFVPRDRAAQVLLLLNQMGEPR